MTICVIGHCVFLCEQRLSPERTTINRKYYKSNNNKSVASTREVKLLLILFY